jgi:hypothetical protein
VALLALSVGVNVGLAVAVLQQRFRPAEPAPQVPPPGVDGWTLSQPASVAAAAEPDSEGGAPPRPPAQGSESESPPEAAELTATGATGAGTAEPRSTVVAPAARPAQVERAAEESMEEPGGADPAGELAWLQEDPPPGRRPPGIPPGPRADGPPTARLEEMAERLGVPLQDRPRFIALQRRFISTTRDGRLQLEWVRRQLKGELTAGEPERSRVERLLAQSAELQAGLERALVEHVLEAREVLDGEAERRYLHFLSRLGAAAGAGGRPGGGPQGPPAFAPPGERPRRRGWPPPRRRGRSLPAPSPGSEPAPTPPER